MHTGVIGLYAQNSWTLSKVTPDGLSLDAQENMLSIAFRTSIIYENHLSIG